MKKFISGFLITLIAVTVQFTNAEIAVIVHPSNSDAIDADVVKRLFLGKQSSFASGAQAACFDQTEGSAVVTEFNKKVLDRSASQLKAYWAKLVFTGKGTPPKALPDDAAVIAAVASSPNGIGYVNTSSVNDSVKVIHTF